MNPMDYSLCRDTVTVYRRQGQGVFRQVHRNAFLSWEEQTVTDTLGNRKGTDFLLILPGQEQTVFPGDRIFAGVGPEIGPEEWGAFVPCSVPGLGQVSYVRVYRFDGQICHTEAGSRRRMRTQL